MGKLFRHKNKPRKETAAFSKNSSRVVRENKDGSTVRQSYLSGRYQKYNKNGKAVKS
jgi:hypothetical protein